MSLVAPKSLPAFSKFKSNLAKIESPAFIPILICLNIQFNTTMAAVPVKVKTPSLKASIYPNPKNVPGIIYGKLEKNSITFINMLSLSLLKYDINTPIIAEKNPAIRA